MHVGQSMKRAAGSSEPAPRLAEVAMAAGRPLVPEPVLAVLPAAANDVAGPDRPPPQPPVGLDAVIPDGVPAPPPPDPGKSPSRAIPAAPPRPPLVRTPGCSASSGCQEIVQACRPDEKPAEPNAKW
mmetsp:Transcript_32443/g.48333  ORF Transcript_32443/g.48333 Transcript_32443/m.48333 type:complete len:127 (-) Transcript_32443:25-405(-)